MAFHHSFFIIHTLLWSYLNSRGGYLCASPADHAHPCIIAIVTLRPSGTCYNEMGNKLTDHIGEYFVSKKQLLPVTVLLALSLLALTACSAASTETPKTFSDPYTYCAAVGQIDAPDARYTGPRI